MPHANQPVHWSGDPYLMKRYWVSLKSWPALRTLALFLSGRERSSQSHLDGLHRSLGAVRHLQLGEDVLEVSLYRGEGEVQRLGYLAVGLARGEAHEHFLLPGG